MSYTFEHTKKQGEAREITILDRDEFLKLSDEEKVDYQLGPMVPDENDEDVIEATLQVQSFVYDLINEENLFNGIPVMLDEFIEKNYKEVWDEASEKSKMDREDYFWEFIDQEGDDALNGIDLHIINKVYKSDFWYSLLINACKTKV